METADLIRYNHTVRELYLDAVEKLPWTEVVANKGLSFGSIRDVFLHLTLVEDRWINYIIPGRFGDWVDADFDDFKEIGALKMYIQKTKTNTEKYLEKLSLEELKRQIVVPWSDKPYKSVSVDPHVHRKHDSLRRSSAALWQMNLEAPYMGFWRFEEEKQ